MDDIDLSSSSSVGENDSIVVESEAEQHAILGTVWGTVGAWKQQMLLIATEYSQSKKRAKQINRDTARAEFLAALTTERDAECISQLRMDTQTFKLLCHTMRERGLLRDTRFVSVEEAVAEFLHTLSHSVRNRTNGVRFHRSGETISRHFQEVLFAINSIATDVIVQAGEQTPRGPHGFEACVGALDGTHIPVRVPLEIQGSFRNRKGALSQNVLAACGFDMNFQYVLPGWEGSATDARVLQSALIREEKLKVPQGRYYLVDAGYANAPGFLAPNRAVRYHLSEFRGRDPQNEKELYNKRHSQARNVIERTFGLLKNRFAILKTATQYDYRDQVSIVSAACVIHNFIGKYGGSDLSADEAIVVNEDGDDVLVAPSIEDEVVGEPEHTPSNVQALMFYSQRERDEWHQFRDNIARRLWNEYCNDMSAMSKGRNVTFNAVMDEELLDGMYEQVLLGRKADRGFKGEAYEAVTAAMTAKSNGEYVLTKQSIVNRCKYHKKNFSVATELLNASGFGYDNTTKRIIAADDVWTAWIEGHPDAKPYRAKVVDYDKLTLIFGADVATGSYARSAAAAPSRASCESDTRGYTPSQADSDVGLTDQLNGFRIASSGGEGSSRKKNNRKRSSEMLEIISCIERSSEGLKVAIHDVADSIRMPKKKAADMIMVELKQIAELSGLDMSLAHEWLTIHGNMATVFLSTDAKRDWILRQLPKIKAELIG